jgi:hypothetical protein
VTDAMTVVTGNAPIPARTRKISDDDLIFTVISLQIGGIVERYAESVFPAKDDPTQCRRRLNAK